MSFDHYKTGAELAADLVNTRGSITGNEYLPDASAAEKLLRDHGLEPVSGIRNRDVEELRALRERLRPVFEAQDERGCARLLNQLLREILPLPQLVSGPGGLQLQHLPRSQSVAEQVAAASLVGLAVLIADQGFDRLGICSADRCRDVFVDTSRNRSRRYCNDTCSSRANVAAFRARHKQHAHE
ncbi:MAG TPA: CGNR zinc finger domain-containing protein [Dehalococcoidia bacterium]|nr:CGNR zinc finger domain-containing protein [Dehalococcoidia bacterium]